MKFIIVLLYCVVAPLLGVLGIFNGEDVKPNSVPFIVNLRYMDRKSVECGGVIISKTVVLTAANCVLNNQDMTVVAGDHNILLNDTTEQYRKIASVDFHPEANITDFVRSYDIVAIFLDKPLEFNEYVQPIKLPVIDQCFKGHVTAYGWGMTTPSEIITSDVLQKHRAPIIDRMMCKNKHDNSWRYDITADEGWKLNRTNYYQEGWLATGNIRGIVGVTFTTSHCKRNMEYPLRTNYNLRGHRSDVILVKWNEPYQKLASCDSSGIIFVWIKYEGRWSIELINDRNTPVTHFSWSHDGRMALICYQDGFVLVGSVAGQRYWSSMLNLDATITCGIWTPDDQQVYFGTTQGQIIVMDVHGAMVSQVQLCSDVGITSMSWSCEKFKMEEGEDAEPGVTNAAKRSFVLAVSFQNGYIYLLKSYDDVSPAHINSGLNGSLGLVMEWSNSRELLAVAGSTHNSPTSIEGQTTQVYENLLKFYTENGSPLYTARIPNNTTPVSALTWGHNDKRIFIATGTQVHIAWVSRRIASLQLLCRLQIQSCISSETLLPKLPLPSRIKTLIGNLFAQTIRCCVPDIKSLREFVSRPPGCSTRLHCTMIRHDDDSNLSSGTCYTLYLEYLGGLVPLLKGKRTSKIRPEFVIFDPQVEDLSILSQCSSDSSGTKSSSGSSQSTSATTGRSESSESDIDDGCRGSPRMQRKKKARTKKKHFHPPSDKPATVEGNDVSDELAYVDTLPEEIKLVEVTSNIWGTKFKIHGLAKTVPSNLGQVTYKTSLLHLQPRQMTLVITELRDDFPTEPDPNFNPNLFSEDEEEQNHVQSTSSGPTRRSAEGSPPIAPMSPRPNRFTSRLKTPPPPLPTQIITNGSSALGPLARAESYEDELSYVELTEATESIKGKSNENGSSPRPGPSYCSLVTQYSRSSTSSSGQSRHAISPLCCEGSVPTLQSPKNAVAPSDIIFDRPPAGQTTLMSYSSNTDYSNNFVQVKNAIMNSDQTRTNSHVNPVPLNLNLNFEKVEKINKEKQALSAKRKDLQYIDEETPTSSISPMIENKMRRTPTVVSITPANLPDSITRSCSVGYLDSVEMVPSDIALSMLRKDAPNKRLILVDRKPQRRNKKHHDDSKKTKLRQSGKSKSLDSCDLFKDTPEPIPINPQMPKLNETSETDSDCISPYHQRYNNSNINNNTNINNILNNNGGDANKLQPKATQTTPQRSPIMSNRQEKICPTCKKSSIVGTQAQTVCVFCRRTQMYKKLDVSLDSKLTHIAAAFSSSSTASAASSGIMSTASTTINSISSTSASSSASSSNNRKDNKIINDFSSYGESSRDINLNKIATDKKFNNNSSKKKTEVITSYTDSPLFSRKYRYETNKYTSDTRSPILNRKGDFLHDKLLMENSSKKKLDRHGSQMDDDIDGMHIVEVTPIEPRASVSLHAQALTTLESIISRLRDLDEGRLTPPSSPQPQRHPRSSPASPAPSKKGKRNQSASPIRHILNSPLLNRRQRKKQQTESSDDENGGTTQNGTNTDEVIANPKQYRDLETFQKAQLRQKLKRGKIEPNGVPSTSQPAPLRREFVMHNKAPMWNENSQVYQLDFGGRVTQESAKNFQIEFRGKQVMQFGRIDGNAYTLDFQYPFSALQAFAVALANVTQRLK